MSLRATTPDEGSDRWRNCSWTGSTTGIRMLRSRWSTAVPSTVVFNYSSTAPRFLPVRVAPTTPTRTSCPHMPDHARPAVVSQTEWDAALAAVTEREETVAAAMDHLAAARKRMPMVRVENDYRFEGPDGPRSLPELFDGRSQLILYRFFFEEGVDGWPDPGCAGCSSVADGIADLGLLHARDITFAMASPAPQANLRRYADRMGWTDVPWYTI